MIHDLLTVKETAELYGVAERTVHRWMRKPCPLPYQKVNGVIWIPLEDLKKWGQEHLRKDARGLTIYTEGAEHESNSIQG